MKRPAPAAPKPSPSESGPPKPEALQAIENGEKFSNGAGMTMIPCQAGSFFMGSPSSEPGRDASFETLHKVTLKKRFWMGQTEVTQEQWKKIAGTNPSRYAGMGAGLPVESCEFDMCMEYCRLLTEQERRAGLIPDGWEYSLPTEAQWEYACRAGNQTAYSFGSDLDELLEAAWYRENSGARPQPVASRKANSWGLFDMHGNVAEWCLDWSTGDYSSKDVTDPANLGRGVGPIRSWARVVRGGSFESYPPDLRCASRSASWAFERTGSTKSLSSGSGGEQIGFRVVLQEKHSPMARETATDGDGEGVSGKVALVSKRTIGGGQVLRSLVYSFRPVPTRWPLEPKTEFPARVFNSGFYHDETDRLVPPFQAMVVIATELEGTMEVTFQLQETAMEHWYSQSGDMHLANEFLLEAEMDLVTLSWSSSWRAQELPFRKGDSVMLYFNREGKISLVAAQDQGLEEKLAEKANPRFDQTGNLLNQGAFVSPGQYVAWRPENPNSAQGAPSWFTLLQER